LDKQLSAHSKSLLTHRPISKVKNNSIVILHSAMEEVFLFSNNILIFGHISVAYQMSKLV